MVLEVDPWASSMLGNWSAIEVHSWPSLLIATHYISVTAHLCDGNICDLRPLPSQGNKESKRLKLERGRCCGNALRGKPGSSIPVSSALGFLPFPALSQQREAHQPYIGGPRTCMQDAMWF